MMQKPEEKHAIMLTETELRALVLGMEVLVKILDQIKEKAKNDSRSSDIREAR